MANPCFAVVDLETTGNQLDHDAIIQIGITFVRNNQIIDTYHSMINTDLNIPPFIQALTSIEKEMLDEAPYFSEIAQDIFSLIKDCVFVAHNVSFDLKFLQKAFSSVHINFQPRKVIDTLELFKITFPTDKSYQLSELANNHGVELQQAHRADEDATTTAKLMIIAFQKLQQLPIDTLKQIYYLSKRLKYDLYDIIFEMVRAHNDMTLEKKFARFEQIIYKKQTDFKAPSHKLELNLRELYQHVTERLGLVYRPQQVYLAEIILDQLMHSEKSMIEAPPGSGKSLAYLLAALVYNFETGKHVMISTNTKILQHQLIEKDIPSLKQALQININASIIKSKKDYISLGLISEILKEKVTNYDVNILKIQLLVWITETETGDIQELNLKGGQKMYFEQKIETYVPIKNDIHYYNYLKRNAHNIQVGITNHAHLIYAAQDNTIYQLFDDCIIDEAHRLPDYALNQVTNALSYADIKYQLGLIGKTENEKLLQEIDELEQKRILEKLDISPIDVFGLKMNISEIHELNETLFEEMYAIIQREEVYSDEMQKEHFVFNFNTSTLEKHLSKIIDKLNHTLEFFNNMSHKTVKTFRKQLLYINDKYKNILQSLKDEHQCYLSIKNLDQKSTINLHVKDYAVKDILTSQVLNKFSALTFISGTLTFNHSFDTYKKWFHAPSNINTYEIDTPAPSSKNRTTLFIPTDIDSYDYQNIEDYIHGMVNYIVEFVSTIESKCLILFTSYKMMYAVYELLYELPELENYILLTQQQNQNYKLIQQFNSFDKAILLGTNTFFEGFDFQAHGIKCVMISKLPFMNQYNTKYWLMKSEFDQPFKEYVLPDAVTRFRQGLGRLIRTETDQGIIVSFDDRLQTSNYKQFFNQSLKDYRQRKGDIKQFNKILKKIKEKYRHDFDL
ncbi:exonuclease domain-containing protein [Staphylococcus sp. SQ8-PEA]|uniref:3'-5' exonuclease DinG n=1 Tax=Staphylococcus marylandisciuri TaxID=2981529 RepID=A0ABT2QNE0_9STAP|nr:helicase C-terminal domain-containing protein [Staphylococcus marylandisciuri]MCU5745495.1 exonuclease domain-containing protein [Staphylococcus marylandisciuri]